MSTWLGAVLGSGVGVALSPVPLVAVIVTLTSPRGKSSGVAMAMGWVVGLLAVVSLTVMLSRTTDHSGSAAAEGAAITTLFVGLLLLVLALRLWRRRPRGEAEPELPKWMSRVGGLNVASSFTLGAALSGLNPKNLVLSIGAGVAIGSGGGSYLVAVTVFALVGSTTVVVPTIAMLASPSTVGPRLETSKSWLARNNSVVLAVLCVVLGMSKLGDGISLLTTQ